MITAVLFLHVVCVLMLAVGDVGALAATMLARRFESPQTVLTLMRYHAAIIRGQLVAAGATECDADLRAAVGSPRVVVGEWATVVLMLAMVFLMVAKPA